MKQVLIVTGGDVDDASAAGFLKTYEVSCVIAVDGGLEAVKRLGLSPDCVVGDFDTVDRGLLEEYKGRNVHFEAHNPEKDCTDTELALLYALSLPGVERIAILGALGRRFDHALGNLQVMKHALDRGIPCEIVDRYNRVCLLDHGKTFRKGEVYGTYVSFIPFTEEVRGLTLRGFRYPLENSVLRQGCSLGISNELSEDQAQVSLEEGILICIESGD